MIDDVRKERINQIVQFCIATGYETWAEEYFNEDLEWYATATLDEMIEYTETGLSTAAIETGRRSWHYVTRGMLGREFDSAVDGCDAIDATIQVANAALRRLPLGKWLDEFSITPGEFLLDVWTGIMLERDLLKVTN